MSLELLKNRFLATHVGYFFPEESNMPINSKGTPDWDTFLIFIINEATECIHNYTINKILDHVPVEKRSLYVKPLSILENTINVKPKQPMLDLPLQKDSYEERFQDAQYYYYKCQESINECNKVVLDAINKLLKDDDPVQTLLDKVRSEVNPELTDEEIEAILIHLSSNQDSFSHRTFKSRLYKTFRKNTLLALKVLNRFAKENEIRFEDSVAVFKEYLI